jgi:hypothetical protein
MSDVFMPDFDNPYAPPKAAPPIVDFLTPESKGLWRKGDLLVMHKRTPLPARCVKSNMPADRRLKRSLYWHHPAIYLSILISILVYIILAVVLRKNATIHIGLSEEWFARRRRAIAISWLLSLGSIGAFFTGAALVEQDWAVWLIGLSPLVFLIGILYGLIGARLVVAKRISDDYVWLKGVCPAFLEGLPHWPHIP